MFVHHGFFFQFRFFLIVAIFETVVQQVNITRAIHEDHSPVIIDYFSSIGFHFIYTRSFLIGNQKIFGIAADTKKCHVTSLDRPTIISSYLEMGHDSPHFAVFRNISQHATILDDSRDTHFSFAHVSGTYRNAQSSSTRAMVHISRLHNSTGMFFQWITILG